MASEHGEIDDPSQFYRSMDSRWFSLEVIDTIHEHIHQGILYTHDQVAVAGDPAELANNASLEYLIVVAAGTIPHLRFGAACGGDARVRIYEGVTASDNGSVATLVNRNRASTNVPSGITVYTGPTISDYGTELGGNILPGGSTPGNNTPGESGDVFGEWILAAATSYVVRLTNISGGSQPASLETRIYNV